MAYWQRKNDRYIFVYTCKDGKQKSLPRKQTKHLDGATDDYIQSWVDQYTVQFEKPRVNPDSLNYQDSSLNKYIDGFEAYRLRRKLNKTMVQNQSNLLREYAVPFFLMQKTPLKDPNQWPAVSSKLLEYLEEKELPGYSIVKLNIALRKFWTWLEEEGVVIGTQKFRLRNPVIDTAKTPLRETLKPEEVLKFVDNCESKDFQLIALLGYFFSLRPFEVFGLKRSDFAAGEKARFLECCQAMKKVKLYDRLAVKVERQKRANGTVDVPKTTQSQTWVACFNEEAAKRIVKLVNDKKADEFLITEFLPDYYIKKWKSKGIKNTVIKDTRRTSLMHLGHHTDFGMYPMSLMHHARHTKLDTTMLYIRRPDEAVEQDDLLFL